MFCLLLFYRCRKQSFNVKLKAFKYITNNNLKGYSHYQSMTFTEAYKKARTLELAKLISESYNTRDL